MTTDLDVAPDGRRVLRTDAPSHRPWRNLLPLRDALLDMGNELVSRLCPDTDFFSPTPGGYVCDLTRPITAADWARLEQLFVIPDGIGLVQPDLVRDSTSWTDIRGQVVVRD